MYRFYAVVLLVLIASGFLSGCQSTSSFTIKATATQGQPIALSVEWKQ